VNTSVCLPARIFQTSERNKRKFIAWTICP